MMIKLLNILKEDYNFNSKLNVPKDTELELNTKSNLAKFIEDDVLDIIGKSYGYIGGNYKASKKGDIEKNYEKEIVSDIDEDPEPDVVLLGKEKMGRFKVGAMATDGSYNSVKKLLDIESKLFNTGAFAELSGKSIKLIKKLNLPCIKNKEEIENLLGKKITYYGKNPTGEYPELYGWYSRNIGGEEKLKILVGKQ